MKYTENISDIARLQPDYLGFIFYEKSARYFNGTIPELPSDVKKVGVFVNATVEDIIDKIEKHSLDFVQLHGEESPEFCEKLKSQLLKVDQDENVDKDKNLEIPAYAGILKVFSIKDHFNFDELEPYESVCDYFLFDTKGKLPGGNGYTFNWEVLKDYPSTKPYFLSGGIGLEEVINVAEFLRRQESQYCHAIDVNSKFEIEPGLKDSEKLEVFIKEIN
ncbi:phosphoribosylanthranilate isomerase [Gelidibacter sp.]|uniref:phosphoribosylanthranilate isomerase n=1 Tax=Gelidibacter sp. TaxID=2018083 RepID=UPI002CF968D5|nr:phosphoribosylanthranilate isomerase [Gelidibacter sp.]HUH27866.1 phosphoribosylanthranilate isomerase [Gelidibacter sp.]